MAELQPDQVITLMKRANAIAAKIVNSQNELDAVGAVMTDYMEGYYDDEPQIDRMSYNRVHRDLL